MSKLIFAALALYVIASPQGRSNPQDVMPQSIKFLYVLFMQEKSYTYILFNKPHGTLYTGVTSNLIKRVQEHKSLTSGFTAKYNVTQLGYFEEHTSVVEAIEREKKIKGGSRKKKIALIESMNPQWKDLFSELGV